jgi:hypothetical protein
MSNSNARYLKLKSFPWTSPLVLLHVFYFIWKMFAIVKKNIGDIKMFQEQASKNVNTPWNEVVLGTIALITIKILIIGKNTLSVMQNNCIWCMLIITTFFKNQVMKSTI